MQFKNVFQALKLCDKPKSYGSSYCQDGLSAILMGR